MRKPIKSIAELKKLASDPENPLECYIALMGGLARSSKTIYWDGKVFEITNEIDDTRQTLTPRQLMMFSNTNIGEAITKGALFTY